MKTLGESGSRMDRYENAIELTTTAIESITAAINAAEAALEELKRDGIAKRPRSHAFFAYSRLRGITQHLYQQHLAAHKARKILAKDFGVRTGDRAVMMYGYWPGQPKRPPHHTLYDHYKYCLAVGPNIGDEHRNMRRLINIRPPEMVGGIECRACGHVWHANIQGSYREVVEAVNARYWQLSREHSHEKVCRGPVHRSVDRETIDGDVHHTIRCVCIWCGYAWVGLTINRMPVDDEEALQRLCNG